MRDKDDDEFELDSVVGRSSYLILAVDSPQALFVGSYPINIMAILMMIMIMTIIILVMILILLVFLMELIIMMTREGAHSPTLFFSRNAIDRQQLEWLDPANKFIAIPITTTYYIKVCYRVQRVHILFFTAHITCPSPQSLYIAFTSYLLARGLVRISKSNKDNCHQQMTFSLKNK